MKLKQSATVATSIGCASLFSQHTSAFTVTPHNHQLRNNIVTTSLSDRSLANSHKQQTFVTSNSFQRTQPDVSTSVRCYASSKKNKSNFLSKAVDKIKDLNPFKKKGAITRKEQAKEEVSSSIDTMFKGAPLGVRMMGKMIKPLVGNLVGNLAQAMEDQNRAMEDLMNDAKYYIAADSNAMRSLGLDSDGTIEVSAPFSQSSSTVSINGKTESRIQASFQVMSTSSRGMGGGVATMSAVNGSIDSLHLNVNGRNVLIDTTKSAGSSASYDSSSSGQTIVEDFDWKAKKTSDGIGKNHNRKGDVIDAEFVDKKVNK